MCVVHQRERMMRRNAFSQETLQLVVSVANTNRGANTRRFRGLLRSSRRKHRPGLGTGYANRPPTGSKVNRIVWGNKGRGGHQYRPCLSSTSVEADRYGGFQIHLSGGCSIAVLPCSCNQMEWILMFPAGGSLMLINGVPTKSSRHPANARTRRERGEEAETT